MKRHPSRGRLQAWLAGSVDPKVESHVSSCERCAETLEEVASEEVLEDLAPALQAALVAPPGLELRLEAGVVARLDARQLSVLALELFGAGWETSRILFGEDPPPERA